MNNESIVKRVNLRNYPQISYYYSLINQFFFGKETFASIARCIHRINPIFISDVFEGKITCASICQFQEVKWMSANCVGFTAKVRSFTNDSIGCLIQSMPASIRANIYLSYTSKFFALKAFCCFDKSIACLIFWIIPANEMSRRKYNAKQSSTKGYNSFSTSPNHDITRIYFRITQYPFVNTSQTWSYNIILIARMKERTARDAKVNIAVKVRRRR